MDFEKRYLESNNNEHEEKVENNDNQNPDLDYNEVQYNDWEQEEKNNKKNSSGQLKENEEADNENDDYFSQNSKYYENLYLNQGKATTAPSKGTKDSKLNNFPRNDFFTIPVKAQSNFSNNQINSLPDVESNSNSVMNSQKTVKMTSNILTANTVRPNTDSNEITPNFEKQIYLKPDSREDELRKFEEEIKDNAKKEFEEAIVNLKAEMNKTIENERKKMEEEVSRKWSEQYDNLVMEIKTKLREEKEKKLHQNMYNKLKPSIEQQIYKNEYTRIEEKIRSEISDRINAEMKEKKQLEIEKIRKKYENDSKNKVEEIEANIRKKHEEELNELVKKEVMKRDKEIHANYLKKFNTFKTKFEAQLKLEYDTKREELLTEVKEMKSNVYRAKCAEKLKINQLNKMKKTLLSREKTQIENVQKLEKVLAKDDDQTFYKSYFSDKENNVTNNQINNKKSDFSESEGFNDNPEVYNKREHQRQNSSRNPNSPFVTSPKKVQKDEIPLASKQREMQYDSNYNYDMRNINELSNFSETSISTNNPYKKINPSNSKSKLRTISEEENQRKNAENCQSDICYNDNVNLTVKPKTNSINLMEINKKIKPFSPQKKNVECNEVKHENRNISLIDGRPGSSLKEDFNKIIQRNLYSDDRYIEASHKKNLENASETSKANITNNSFVSRPKSPLKDFQKELPQKLNSLNIKQENSCQSLRVSETMPIGMIEFGKFLIGHIEKEENYRILLEKEFKKMKLKIKKIFDEEKASDHCLLDYMIELWDKLEISNERRYRILSDLTNQKSSSVYNFLDKETELLTEYYKNANVLLSLIKTREKLKSKLQQKSNRNELLKEDKEKFKSFTKEISKKITLFKTNFNYDIIWKGLFYEWLVNYENWFYENNNQS